MLHLRNVFLKRFQKHDPSEETPAEFTVWQFFMISLLLQLNIEERNMYNGYLLLDNPGIIYLLYVAGMLIFAYPLMTTAMFFGYYTNRQVLGLFDCVPLFKGIGYMMLIAEVINYQFSMIHTVFFTYIFSYRYYDEDNTLHSFGVEIKYKEPIWYTCNFPGANERCYPMSRNITKPKCNPNVEYELSIAQFINRNAFERNDLLELTPFSVHKTMLILQFLNCLSLTISLWIKLRKSWISMLFLVQIIGTAMSFVILTSVILMSPSLTHHHTISLHFLGMKHPITHILFWAKLICHASHILHTPRIVWLGSIMPNGTNPHTTVLLTYGIKLIILGFNVVYSKFCLNNLTLHHNITDPDCKIYIDGHDFIYSVIFDILGRFDQPYLWLTLYTISKVLTTWVDNSLTLSIILNAISSEFEWLQYWPFTVSTIFSIIMFLISIILYTPMGNTLNYSWHHFEFVTLASLILVLTTICFNFIYSNRVIANDYYFTFKSYPANVMIFNMNLASILTLFSFSAVICNLIFGRYESFPIMMKISCVAFALFCTGPLVFLMVKYIALGLKDNLTFADRPLIMWGPYEAEKLKERKLFIPQLNIKYRHHDIDCKHNCLHKVKKFKDEIDITNQHYYTRIKKYVDQDKEKYKFLLETHQQLDIVKTKGLTKQVLDFKDEHSVELIGEFWSQEEKKMQRESLQEAFI